MIYVIGVLLVGGSCFLAHALQGATILPLRIVVGFIWGFPCFILSVGPVIIYGLLVDRLSIKYGLHIALKYAIYALPIAVFAFLKLDAALESSSPGALFRRYIVEDVPSSLVIVDYGGRTALDCYWAFRCRIDENDLQRILESKRFAYFRPGTLAFQRHVEHMTGVEPLLGLEYKIFVADGKGSERLYALVDKDALETTFVYSTGQ